MVPGPFKWVEQEDLFALGSHYGQARSFPSLQVLGVASRSRAALFENLQFGGVQVQDKRAAIQAARSESPQCLGRQVRWDDWYEQGVVQDMAQALQ